MNAKLCFLITMLLSCAVSAEEGGSGHYMPGATASFIDALPGRPAPAYVNEFTYYNGTAGASRPLEFDGQIVANAEATAYADTSVLLYGTPWRLFGGNYAAAMAIPYVWMEVQGDVGAGPFTKHQRDTANGIGDLTLLPFMLGWTNGPDLKYDLRLSLIARGSVRPVETRITTAMPTKIATLTRTLMSIKTSTSTRTSMLTRT